MAFVKNKQYQEGQAIFTAVVFLMFISLVFVLTLGASATIDISLAKNLFESKKSFFLAEAGAEDLAYRILRAKNYSSRETITIEGHYATTTVSGTGNEQEIISTGDFLESIRKIKINLVSGSSASFHYGVQVGDGGITLRNSAQITGNLYSNGPVESFNSNKIYGDAVSAGPDGSIAGVYATGTAYSHDITDSYIEKDAYYQTIANSTVLGNLYPNSSDQPYAELPISDSLIGDWENAAASGEIISSPCPYTINSDIALGPAKINCDLEITGDPVVTISGPIWVSGNIIIKNTAVIKIDSALGKKSVPIVADNASNRITSSKIELQNSVVFQNSGTEGSYILLVSQNNSAENEGDEEALFIKNTVSGDLLLYAGHGQIYLDNRSDLKEVTGYKITLSNQANVIYDTGLASLLFESGPSGGFSINSWREIK